MEYFYSILQEYALALALALAFLIESFRSVCSVWYDTIRLWDCDDHAADHFNSVQFISFLFSLFPLEMLLLLTGSLILPCLCLCLSLCHCVLAFPSFFQSSSWTKLKGYRVGVPKVRKCSLPRLPWFPWLPSPLFPTSTFTPTTVCHVSIILSIISLSLFSLFLSFPPLPSSLDSNSTVWIHVTKFQVYAIT